VHQPDLPRAFAGPGLRAERGAFTHEAALTGVDLGANRVSFAGGPPWADLRDGSVRWIEGPHAGLARR
jgi:hypothetical protein